MAKVRVTSTIRIGGRTLPVKQVPNLAPLVVGSVVTATANQLRVLAEEARELIRDRVFQGVPEAPGRVAVARPPRFRAKNIPAVTRDAGAFLGLKRRTILRKARARRPRLDGRILLASGDYMRNIEIFRGDQPANGGVYYMVRPAQQKHAPGPHGSDSSPINLSLLAKVHEFGSAKHKIPARPVWGPAVRRITQLMRAMRPTIRAEALRLAARQVR